jgi:hypothetical protein
MVAFMQAKTSGRAYWMNAFTAPRRSQRILLSIPVIVSGKRANGSSFVERTRTLVVSAHGALIQLREHVLVKQVLQIKNIATGDEVSCTVVDATSGTKEVPEIGIGFSKPSPNFWRVAFPPEDWNPRGPEARHASSRDGSQSPTPVLVKK